MSRGPSPSPGANQIQYSSPMSTTNDPPSRPPRAPLRVNTEQLISSGAGGGFGTASRFRSNSSSTTFSPNQPAQQHPAAHQFSRSLSHNHAALSSQLPLSPDEGRGRNDVALTVSGLRGMIQSPSQSPSHGGINGSNTNLPLRSPSRSVFVVAEGSTEENTLRRIHEALEKSNDAGDTLDLSRRGIDGIGHEAVEMFRKGVGKDSRGVWRLALSYNSLRDGSIVDSFSQLSKLRYLNLKGNALTAFPAALCDLPALEILDLSKNRITAFPEQPRRLVQLKVLSLTSNKIYALPSYLTAFNHLKVFKVDQNPIEWPPREVLGSLIDHDVAQGAQEGTPAKKKDEDLRPWIENMKSWMRQKATETDKLLIQSQADEDAYLASEEEPISAVSTSSMQNRWPLRSDLPTSQQTIRPVREGSVGSSSPAPVLRTLAQGRNRAATLSEESLNRSISPPLVPPNRPFAPHSRTQSNSSFTPPNSASASSSSSHSRNPSTSLPKPPPIPAAVGHSRGASYTATQRLSGQITAKKSLPDLRQSHAQIILERRNEGQAMPETRALGLGINTPNGNRVGSRVWSSQSPGTSSLSPVTPSRPLMRKGSADMLRQGKLGNNLNKKSEESPQVDESRNSYFRRLSTLPASTLSKAIPPALLGFIDAVRGILFALSQLHSALRQYLIFAVQDRVAGVFTRLMEPANTYMNNLINALDRFDSMSRRSTPPVSAIRGVAEAAKESVSVFAKVVAVLRLQMPALRGSDERYTKTLLLMIYGSMAEVASSWEAMVPVVKAVKSLINDEGGSGVGGLRMAMTGSLMGRTPISPIPERGESRSPSSVARSSVSTAVGASPLRQGGTPLVSSEGRPGTGRNRRKGGSFSTEDVEKGMLMGSPGAASGSEAESAVGYTRHRPSESAQLVLEDQTEESEEDEGEQETLMPLPAAPFARKPNIASSIMPVTPPELTQNPQPVAMSISTAGSHTSRRGHQPTSSAGSMTSGLQPLRKLSVDVRPPTPASATIFDEDLLDVIETATEIGFTVWLRLAEDVGVSPISFTSNSNGPTTHGKSASQGSISSSIGSSSRPASISPSHHAELSTLLSQAEHITSTLRETIAGLRANPHSWSYTSLPDDAQVFIKTVVRVSELVKRISSTHSFPSSVRQSMSKLTQATRECAILIQVSSLRPGMSTPALIPPNSATSTRPSSPMTTRNMNGGMNHQGHRAHHSRSSQGAASSAEDLTVPHSAGWAPTAAAIGRTTPNGLRGLQLPNRQLARSRSPGLKG